MTLPGAESWAAKQSWKTKEKSPATAWVSSQLEEGGEGGRATETPGHGMNGAGGKLETRKQPQGALSFLPCAALRHHWSAGICICFP